jgi:hypothetical protein
MYGSEFHAMSSPHLERAKRYVPLGTAVRVADWHPIFSWMKLSPAVHIFLRGLIAGDTEVGQLWRRVVRLRFLVTVASVAFPAFLHRAQEFASAGLQG